MEKHFFQNNIGSNHYKCVKLLLGNPTSFKKVLFYVHHNYILKKQQFRYQNSANFDTRVYIAPTPKLFAKLSCMLRGGNHHNFLQPDDVWCAQINSVFFFCNDRHRP